MKNKQKKKLKEQNIEKLPKKAMSDRTYIILVVTLAVVAVIIRVFRYTLTPEGVQCDTAMSSVNALSLLNYGTDRFGMYMPVHFAAWRFSQQSALLSYITVPFIAVLGFNKFAVLLPSLIISLLGITVLFLFAKKAFGRSAALIVLAMCAINPWHIMQSRWSIDCNLFPHFLLFSMYFLFLGTEKKRYLYISMVLFGLTMYTYGMALYTVPLMLVAACAYMLAKRIIKFKEAAICGGIYICISLPIFLMVIVNALKIPSIVTPFFTIPYFPYTNNYSDIAFYAGNVFEQLAHNFWEFIFLAFFQRPDAYTFAAIPGYGAMYLFSMPLVIFGIIYIVKLMRNAKAGTTVKFPVVLLMLWFAASIVVGMITNRLFTHRINIVYYPLIMFLGLGIYWIKELLKKFGWDNMFSTVVIITYCIAFISFSTAYFDDENKNTWAYETHFFAGFGEAMEYVDKYDYDKIYVTGNTQNSGAAYVSEILAMYHHKIDAEYIQGKRVIYNEDGAPLMPYKERYNYIEFNPEWSTIGSVRQNEAVAVVQFEVQDNGGTGRYEGYISEITPDNKTVFVMNNNEEVVFSREDFDIIRYKYYSAVVPKGAALK